MKTMRDRPRKPFPFHFLNSSIFQNNCILGTDSDREQADTRCSKTKNSPKQHSPISLIKQMTSTCFNQILYQKAYGQFFGIVDKIRILSMSRWCHIFSTAVLYLFTYPCNTLFTLSQRDPIVFQLFFTEERTQTI